MLVLDLNGTLMHRVSRVLGSAKAIRARPGLDRFLKFATANFAVMVWSSAQPFSVFNMIDMTFGSYESKLVRVWDRRFCNIDGKYFAKSQTIKDLRRITDGYHLGMSPYRSLLGEYDGFLGMCPDKKNHWKLDNILLIDDSEAKALRQKDNHILMSTYEGGKVDTELDLLIKYLQLYIDSKEHHLTLLDYVKEHKWQEFKRVSTREKINEDEISINFQDLAL
ncbi:hypothetical protein GGI07_000213 [Coemansia sp. Benny D115]|nr:hypothetical protein GGI07_000213 [Coemansia sp. Benny D115]